MKIDFKQDVHTVASTTTVSASHLADHGGQVASIKQRVLGISHSGWIFKSFLIGKSPPLWSDVDHAVTLG